MAVADVRAADGRVTDEAKPGVTTLVPEPMQLGRYRVLSPIGSGGMAAVYAGQPIDDTRRLVAIKVMHAHLARDQRFAAMFLDESRIACQVASPHVVRSYDYGSADGSLYLVMDYVPGVSLRDLLLAARDTNQPLPQRVAAALVLDAASGLSAAHTTRGHDGTPLGIVHRDVSPHNVLIGTDGRARVSDFGVAYAVDRLSRTTTGGVKGKPGYVSPEHFDHERVDQRSDIFCLGVVAWECFAGRTLFRAAHPLAQLRQVLTSEIPRLDDERPDISEQLARAIARTLERDLDKRTPTMEEFARELRAAAEAGEGVASPGEVEASLRTLCANDMRELDASIAQARARLKSTHAFKVRARRYAPWFGVIMSMGAAVFAALPDAAQVGGQAPREQVVPATAVTAPLEPVPAQEMGTTEPEAVPMEPVIEQAPTARKPVARMELRKKAARGRASRRVAKRVPSRPKVKEASASASSGSPLLDVGAFERERKRKD